MVTCLVLILCLMLALPWGTGLCALSLWQVGMTLSGVFFDTPSEIAIHCVCLCLHPWWCCWFWWCGDCGSSRKVAFGFVGMLFVVALIAVLKMSLMHCNACCSVLVMLTLVVDKGLHEILCCCCDVLLLVVFSVMMNLWWKWTTLEMHMLHVSMTQILKQQ